MSRWDLPAWANIRKSALGALGKGALQEALPSVLRMGAYEIVRSDLYKAALEDIAAGVSDPAEHARQALKDAERMC